MARTAETFFQSFRFSVTINGEDIPMCEVKSEAGGRLKLRAGHKAGRKTLTSSLLSTPTAGRAEIRIWSNCGRGPAETPRIQWVRKYDVTFTGFESTPLDLDAVNGNVAMDAVILSGVTYELPSDAYVPVADPTPPLSNIIKLHPESTR